MSIFDGQSLLERLSRIIQTPIKGLTKQTPAVDCIKSEAKLPLNNNLIGVTKRTRSIRKREFDKLRILRLHQTTAGGERRQQFFHTSMHTQVEDRASTLKKIDEIEAQMSMQWWKTDRLDLDKDL